MDGTLAERVDGEPLEEVGELAMRLSPRDRELLHRMSGALDPVDARLDLTLQAGRDPGGESGAVLRRSRGHDLLLRRGWGLSPAAWVTASCCLL